MRIGLSIYSLWEEMRKGMTPVEAIEWIGAHGGEHFELVSFVVDLVQNEELQNQILEASQRTGVAISAYCLAADVLNKTEEEYENEVQRILMHLDIAGKMGVKVFRFDMASFTRTSEENVIENFDKDLNLLTKTCRRVADYAKQYGIIATVENHGCYINGGDRVRRLILAVDRDNFRCTLDVGNCLCVDEDPLACVETLLPFAAAIHFKDFYVRIDKDIIGDGGWLITTHNKYLRGAIVGHGEIDVLTIMKRIRESGYDGNVTIEFEGMEDCKEGSRIGMENVRRISEICAEH